MDKMFGNEDKIVRTLSSIGLSKNEILVYLSLVKNPNSTALDISKDTGIHRTNTYDTLRRLTDIGFVAQLKDADRTSFRAMKPERIKEYLKMQQQEIDSIIPSLMELSKQTPDKESVSISKGNLAVRNSALELLKENDDILVYGASKQSVETLGEGFLKEFHKARIKNGIKMKHIYNSSEIDRIRFLNKMKYTQARHLGDRFYTNLSIVTSGNLTLIMTFTNPATVIKINSKEVAEMYRNSFYLLWDLAKTN